MRINEVVTISCHLALQLPDADRDSLRVPYVLAAKHALARLGEQGIDARLERRLVHDEVFGLDVQLGKGVGARLSLGPEDVLVPLAGSVGRHEPVGIELDSKVVGRVRAHRRAGEDVIQALGGVGSLEVVRCPLLSRSLPVGIRLLLAAPEPLETGGQGGSARGGVESVAGVLGALGGPPRDLGGGLGGGGLDVPRGHLGFSFAPAEDGSGHGEVAPNWRELDFGRL